MRAHRKSAPSTEVPCRRRLPQRNLSPCCGPMPLRRSRGSPSGVAVRGVFPFPRKLTEGARERLRPTRRHWRACLRLALRPGLSIMLSSKLCGRRLKATLTESSVLIRDLGGFPGHSESDGSQPHFAPRVLIRCSYQWQRTKYWTGSRFELRLELEPDGREQLSRTRPTIPEGGKPCMPGSSLPPRGVSHDAYKRYEAEASPGRRQD